MSNPVSAIIDKLKKCDDEYTNDGNSSLSDKEYDALRRKAQAMDPGNAYFATVGSDVRGGKIKLPYIMGSLDQKFDSDIPLWIRNYNLMDECIVVSDKLDGISCMLTYRNGELEIAYSRGNGMEGADITRHIRKVPSVPQKLRDSTEAYLVVRGELIMKNKVFADKYADEKSNPRAMVAGCFNRSTTEQSILDDIEFISYQVVAHSDISGNIASKLGELEFLKREGFRVVPFTTLRGRAIKADELATYTAGVKKASAREGYELDGIVLTINDYAVDTNKRKSTTTLNPEHSIKYKIVDDDQTVITECTNVLWEISKSGFYKPRVQMKPVNLYGTNVTFASGFNAKFIFENGIGPGAKLRITKSGSVIPYIMEVTQKATPKMPSEAWDWNESNVEAVTTDDSNPDVKFKQILSFVETLKVELLKESTLREAWTRLKLYELSYEEIIPMLFDLTDGEWVKLVGANGNKIAVSLRRRGENLDLATFLGAVKYLGFGFGVRKAKALLSQVDESKLRSLTEADFINLDGFDTSAKRIISGMPQALDMLDLLLKLGYVELVREAKTSELTGVNVVFTGFRDADLEKTIELAGGKIGSSVSSKTTHLLAPDTNSSSGKFKKAKELGVKVMTADQFKDEYNL